MSNQKTVNLFSNIQQMGYILGDMNEDEYQNAARTLGQITLKYDGKLNEHMDHVEVFLQAIRDTNPTEAP